MCFQEQEVSVIPLWRLQSSASFAHILFSFLICGNGSPPKGFLCSFFSCSRKNDKAQEAKNTMFPWASMQELPGQWFGGLCEWWEEWAKPQWIPGCLWPGANCVPVPWTASYFLKGSMPCNCEWILCGVTIGTAYGCGGKRFFSFFYVWRNLAAFTFLVLVFRMELFGKSCEAGLWQRDCWTSAVT